MSDPLTQLITLVNDVEKSITFDTFTFVVLLIGGIILHFSISRVKKQLMDNKVPSTLLVIFILRLVYSFLLFILFLLILSFFEVPLAPFLAVLVAALVAIAISLRDSLNNIASGFIIIATRPFNVGDYIETPTIELSMVENINLFYTTLLTKTGINLQVQNSKLWTSTLKNITQSEDICIELLVPLNFNGGDIDKACKDLSQALLKEKNILTNPSPNAAIWTLRSNGIDIMIHAWVENKNFHSMRLKLPGIVKKYLETSKVYNTPS